MTFIKSTHLRYALNLPVSSYQLDKFVKAVRNNPALAEMSSANKKTFKMMRDYLKNGNSSAKMLRIDRILARVEVNDSYSISNSVELKRIYHFDSSATVLGKQKTNPIRKGIIHVDHENNKTVNPRFVSDLMQGARLGVYSYHTGTNRDVFINKKTGDGYKIFKDDSSWSWLHEADLRLNDIYKNKGFYKGKYADVATNKIITLVDDTAEDGKLKKIKAFQFKKIPNSEHLKASERIPLSVLRMLEKCGYMPFDVKPDNFVKVKNEKGGYDYLPIDSKQIGLKGSNTMRTKDVHEFKRIYGEYYYKGVYVDRKA